MNLLKNRSPVAGNALIYVLIAIALLAALTMMMTRQNDQGGSDISAEQADIYASKLITYTATAKSIVDQMAETGVSPDQIDITSSGNSYDTPPHAKKIFHPDGGGLIRQKPDSRIFPPQSSGIPPEWYFGYNSNVEWTPTTANDLKLTAYLIDKNICAAINNRMTGSKAIPALPASPSIYFVEMASTSLTKTDCPACEGYPSLCVSNTAGTEFAFYSIIGAR